MTRDRPANAFDAPITRQSLPPPASSAANSALASRARARQNRLPFLLFGNLAFLAVIAAGEILSHFAIRTGSQTDGQDLIVYQEYVQFEWNLPAIMVLFSIWNACLWVILRFVKQARET